MKQKIFVYGTLKDPKVQEEIIGKIPTSSTDTISGFKMSEIIVNNKTYSVIIQDPASDEKINGVVLETYPRQLIFKS